ncbi:dihydroxyacetone kinase subunit DhaK, partial [Staphylococcus epidermidis]|uniref:dihydroxyacetone kinase subunit DhaK n=1 Tax=Staphylococcus epidermidis TaxID=1282 RepID=UPI0037D9BD3E
MQIPIPIHPQKPLHPQHLQPINLILQPLLHQLYKQIHKKPLSVIVNAIPPTPLSQLNILTKYLHQQFNHNHIHVKQSFLRHYITPLHIQPFSITLLPFTQQFTQPLPPPTPSKY